MAERLVLEIEKKKMLNKGQTDFRKELETIDNIYTLNYIIYKYTMERKRLVALFVERRLSTRWTGGSCGKQWRREG